MILDCCLKRFWFIGDLFVSLLTGSTTLYKFHPIVPGERREVEAVSDRFGQGKSAHGTSCCVRRRPTVGVCICVSIGTCLIFYKILYNQELLCWRSLDGHPSFTLASTLERQGEQMAQKRTLRRARPSFTWFRSGIQTMGLFPVWGFPDQVHVDSDLRGSSFTSQWWTWWR